MSRCSKNLYSKRQKTLSQMWKAASTINDELRMFATQVGIGTTDPSCTAAPSESQSVQRFLLNNRKTNYQDSCVVTADGSSILSNSHLDLPPLPYSLGSRSASQHGRREPWRLFNRSYERGTKVATRGP
jgi:hypothetical protein